MAVRCCGEIRNGIWGDDHILISHRFEHVALGAIAFPVCPPCISTLHAESGRGNTSVGQKYTFCFGKES